MVLPLWPAHCDDAVPHAGLAEGSDAIGVLARERAQLDFANQRARNCAEHYRQLKRELEQ